MSRAIGDYNYKGNASLSVLDQKVIAVADVADFTVYKGDRVLVCCDGIVEQLTNEQVSSFLYAEIEKSAQNGDGDDNSKATDPVQVCIDLIDYSLNSGSKVCSLASLVFSCFVLLSFYDCVSSVMSIDLINYSLNSGSKVCLLVGVYIFYRHIVSSLSPFVIAVLV
jgi:hypothetical protein